LDKAGTGGIRDGTIGRVGSTAAGSGMTAGGGAETSNIAAPPAIAPLVLFAIAYKSYFALNSPNGDGRESCHENHVCARGEEQLRADDRHRARRACANRKARTQRRGGARGRGI